MNMLIMNDFNHRNIETKTTFAVTYKRETADL